MNLKNILFVISFLFISLYLPFLVLTYSPFYYQSQIENNTFAIDNLRSFFLYQEQLNPEIWNEKEILHMTDVRNLFFITHIFASLSLVFLFLIKPKNILKYFLYVNGTLLFIFLLIFFFFSFFWKNIFHSLLFRNNAWIITPEDISYYLFPESFFIKYILILFISYILINIIFLAVLKKQSLFKKIKSLSSLWKK